MMDQDDSAGADPQQTIRDLDQQAAKDKEAIISEANAMMQELADAQVAGLTGDVEILLRVAILRRGLRLGGASVDRAEVGVGSRLHKHFARRAGRQEGGAHRRRAAAAEAHRQASVEEAVRS